MKSFVIKSVASKAYDTSILSEWQRSVDHTSRFPISTNVPPCEMQDMLEAIMPGDVNEFKTASTPLPTRVHDTSLEKHVVREDETPRNPCDLMKLRFDGRPAVPKAWAPMREITW